MPVAPNLLTDTTIPKLRLKVDFAANSQGSGPGVSPAWGVDGGGWWRNWENSSKTVAAQGFQETDKTYSFLLGVTPYIEKG